VVPVAAVAVSAPGLVRLPSVDDIRARRIVKRDVLAVGRWIAPDERSALAAPDQLMVLCSPPRQVQAEET
jgi:hypothetical protein